MKRPSDERLLAFLEGEMDAAERDALLDALDADPELAERLRAAAVGLDALRGYTTATRGEPQTAVSTPILHGAPVWRVAAAAVLATLLVAGPTTWWMTRSDVGGQPLVPTTGQPEAPDPTYVLVLHGRWPDAGSVPAEEARRRARQYWDWTSSLAEQGLLVAAGDLSWEPGERLGPEGEPLLVAAEEVERPEFPVGMFALRVASYEEAREVAAQCPHLLYGGSVSVRRVGGGFVTVPGEGDWSE